MSVNDLFKQDLKIINVGLETFYRDLKSQNVHCIHVNWKPKAGGNPKMVALLNKLKKTAERP